MYLQYVRINHSLIFILPRIAKVNQSLKRLYIIGLPVVIVSSCWAIEFSTYQQTLVNTIDK